MYAIYRSLLDKGWKLAEIDRMDFWKYVHIMNTDSPQMAEEETQKTYDFLLQ